jgi:hypothetical protein
MHMLLLRFGVTQQPAGDGRHGIAGDGRHPPCNGYVSELPQRPSSPTEAEFPAPELDALKDARSR